MKYSCSPAGLAFAIALATGFVARADVTAGWTGSQVIPDNNANGVAFGFNFSSPSPAFISNVTVDLNIAGGYNGDLYAYLSHGSGFSVLLNRIGSTAVNPGGSAVSGMNVEFSDSYGTDIHTASNNPLTGHFAPDGRNVSPFGALNTDPRTAMLSSFDGLNVNGGWTLFVADVSPLGVSTLDGWTVNVTTTVPEPGSAALLGVAMVLGLGKGMGRLWRK